VKASHIVLLAAFALLAAAAAFGVAACAGGTTYAAVTPCTTGSCASPSPSPSPSSSPSDCAQPIAPAATEMIGVDLSINYCTDSTYQAVIGYFVGWTAPNAGEVITITHSSIDHVQFKNVDNQPHTAADLGPWTGSYPPNGPDPAATPSPKGTDISATGFTAGNLNPGQKSRPYIADVPGVYIFGCAYHYNSNNMRTVIIVQ
jgi:hypothetical protein